MVRGRSAFESSSALIEGRGLSEARRAGSARSRRPIGVDGPDGACLNFIRQGDSAYVAFGLTLPVQAHTDAADDLRGIDEAIRPPGREREAVAAQRRESIRFDAPAPYVRIGRADGRPIPEPPPLSLEFFRRMQFERP